MDKQQQLQLRDTVYVITGDRKKIEAKYVIGIYSLEKIPQDKQDYFFDTPSQLIAYGDNLEIHRGPIEYYQFKNIYDPSNNIFIDRDKAEAVLKSYQEQYDKQLDKSKRIDALRQEIEKIELE